MKNCILRTTTGVYCVILLISVLIFYSCQNDNWIEPDPNQSMLADDSKFNEDNYEFTTINLWGSEAAVIDAGDYYIFQGDIYLDKEDVSLTRGAGRIDRRWPNNKVIYTLNGVPANQLQTLYEAMHHIESRTYIDFVPRYNESSYVQINYIASDEWQASSNYIGMKGGKQELKISRASWNKGTIMHEIGHAIGLYHEQCRADRDQYVRIDFSGMSDSDRHQFKKYTELGENGRDVGAYDFNSIMHYGPNLNGRQVMWRLDGQPIYANRSYLSSGDITTLGVIQPAIYGTFYDPYGYNEPYDGDYECRRSKFLRLPEGADIGFKLQYKYNPSSLGGYSISDFNMSLVITVIETNTRNQVYSNTISLSQTSSYKDVLLPVIKIPQGAYTTTLRLVGTVNGTSTADKLSVLRRLMYNPLVYLHLNSFKVNNRSLTIPSDFGYDASLRRLTFVSIE